MSTTLYSLLLLVAVAVNVDATAVLSFNRIELMAKNDTDATSINAAFCSGTGTVTGTVAGKSTSFRCSRSGNLFVFSYEGGVFKYSNKYADWTVRGEDGSSFKGTSKIDYKSKNVQSPKQTGLNITSGTAATTVKPTATTSTAASASPSTAAALTTTTPTTTTTKHAPEETKNVLATSAVADATAYFFVYSYTNAGPAIVTAVIEGLLLGAIVGAFCFFRVYVPMRQRQMGGLSGPQNPHPQNDWTQPPPAHNIDNSGRQNFAMQPVASGRPAFPRTNPQQSQFRSSADEPPQPQFGIVRQSPGDGFTTVGLGAVPAPPHRSPQPPPPAIPPPQQPSLIYDDDF